LIFYILKYIYPKTFISFLIGMMILTLGYYHRLTFSSRIIQCLNIDNITPEFIHTFSSFLDTYLSPRLVEINLNTAIHTPSTKELNQPASAPVIVGKKTSLVAEEASTLLSQQYQQENIVDRIDTSRILIIGDSRIQGELGIEIEIAFQNTYHPELLYRLGIPKSGLSRPDYYNWPNEFETLVEKYKPTLVIVMFGANDAQRMYIKNVKVEPDKDQVKWNTEYLQRAKDFSHIATTTNAKVIWIGNPITGLDYYNKLMTKVNTLTNKSINNKNTYYLDTWTTLTDDKQNYTARMMVDNNEIKVRTKDTIHLTREGGKILAEALVKRIKEIDDL